MFSAYEPLEMELLSQLFCVSKMLMFIVIARMSSI